MTLAFAPVAATACAIVSKIGHDLPSGPSNVWPPLPGVTPPTTCVPYSIICRAWNEPSRPVMPCTSSFVFSSMKIDMLLPRPRELDRLLHDLVHRRRRTEPGVLQDLQCCILVRARQPDHDRHIDLDALCGRDDAVGDVVAAGDAAEGVEADHLHVRVGGDDAQRVDDLLRVRAAADVEEVRRLAAVELDQVHRRHCEACAVHTRADVAIELDEREPRLACLDLGLGLA